jgi:hypothetical protein
MQKRSFSSNQFLANVRCTKLVTWMQFLFYITYCSEKKLNITYSESVFIALVIQHAEETCFKQSVSCKRTLHETGCLEPAPPLNITYCSGKTLSITYSESVFIALVIQCDEQSGFKQSVSCKPSFHETGCLEPVPLLYNLLQWKSFNYCLFRECIYSLRYPKCRRDRFQATSFLQTYVARNWLLGCSSSFI